MHRAALVAAVALGVAGRVAVWPQIFAPGGTELVPADSHGYLHVVRSQLEAGRWVTRTVPDVAFPDGGPQYFPWLHLTLLTAAVKVAGLARAEEVAALTGPIVWLSWMAIALAWLGRRLKGWWLVFVAAVWSWCLVHVEVSTLGTADHHVHEAFVAVAAALATARVLESPGRRGAVALGLVLGLSRLLVTSAFALYPLVALCIIASRQRGDALSRAFVVSAVTAFASGLAGALLVGAGLDPAYELFGVFQPLLAVASLLFAAAAVAPRRAWPAGVAGAVALALLVPELGRALGHLQREDAILGVIDEATPLWSDWRFGLTLCGPLVLMAPFTLAARRTPWNVTVVVMTGGWLIAALAQARFAAALMGVLPIAVAAGFQTLYEVRPRAIAALLAVLVLVTLPAALRGAPVQTPPLAARVRPTLEWMRERAPRRAVVADPYLGLFTAWYARRPVVASTLAQMTGYASANERARAVLAARDDASAEAGLAALDAGLVIASPPFSTGEVTPGSLAERLERPVLEIGYLKLLWESAESRRDDGRALLRVFERVPGASVEGAAAAGTEVVGRVAIDSGRGEPLEFRAAAVANETGTFRLRVPQPGLLELSTGASVTVTGEAVERGETLRP